jgi:hypothetical protein
VRLCGFAIISIVGPAHDWREMSLRRGGALLRVMSATCDANGVALFVGSDIQLSEFPTADEDSMVEITFDTGLAVRKGQRYLTVIVVHDSGLVWTAAGRQSENREPRRPARLQAVG